MSVISLKQKTVSGVTWTAIDTFANYGLQFVISIVIARLLDPSDYGVIAIVMLFITLAAAFVNSGFSQALVRQRDLSHETCSSVFYFNLAMALGLYLLLCMCSPLVAVFFKMPVLTSLLRILGLTLIMNALTVVQSALLTRAVRFRTQAVANLFALTLSGGVGLYLAYAGYGVWALAGQSLASSVILACAYWALNAWRPQRHFALVDIAKLWGFSSRLLASTLLDSIFRQLQTIAIGRFYSAQDLGFYTQGRRLPDLIAANTTFIVQRVTYPVLATVQSDNDRLRLAQQKVIQTVTFAVFPALLVMLAVAHPLVIALLTAKWAPAVPYLRLVCMAALLYPLHAINLSTCMVKGRSDLVLKLEVVKKGIGLALVLAAIPFGVNALVLTEVVLSLASFYVNAKFGGDLIGYSWVAQLEHIGPAFALAALAAGAAWAAGLFVVSPPAVMVAIQVAVAAAVYLGLAHRLRLAGYVELRGILEERIRSVRGVVVGRRRAW
jgi:teichuronic acid exporter